MVDNAYRMAGDIGLEGVRKFESVLNEFKSWCNQRHTEKEKEYNGHGKKKNVPMTSNKYTSTVKCLFNTYHMWLNDR